MDKLSTLLACLPPSDFKNIFTQEIEQLRAKVAELQSSHDALEAKLAKYEKLEPACWMTPDGEGWRMRTKPPENDVPLGWMPLYALEDLK